MYIFIYICVCEFIYICINTYIQLFISSYVHMYVSIYSYVYTYISTYIYNIYVYNFKHMYMYAYVYIYICISSQGWTNRTLAVHERTSVHFLVLPGSLLSITEITEYTYFSPLKPNREFRYKSEQNIVPMDLIIESILFLRNRIFTFYYTRVQPQCD